MNNTQNVFTRNTLIQVTTGQLRGQKGTVLFESDDFSSVYVSFDEVGIGNVMMRKSEIARIN